ncbi:hypothetical protein BJY00DRAFT_291659 [Aspergillus carlsbadensis]|nr:hypothetical protein BJY00DRAFT_291659 [Aspergillus carlsbadensis]
MHMQQPHLAIDPQSPDVNIAPRQPPKPQLHVGIPKTLQQNHLQMHTLKSTTDASLPSAWAPLSPVGFRGDSLVRGLSRILIPPNNSLV